MNLWARELSFSISQLLCSIVFALFVYSIPFVIIVADECWLETKVTRSLPQWTQGALRVVYRPLLGGL
jgi:hypothetical protein